MYVHWRGEWGLVSYMSYVHDPRSDKQLWQIENLGNPRRIGPNLALFAWFVFSVDPYTLSLFGWAVSIPCFWIILTWKQATFVHFIPLTYNLSVLYAYSLATSSAEGGGRLR